MQVKFIFSGHCHRNYVARIKRPVSASGAADAEAANDNEAFSPSRSRNGASSTGVVPCVGGGVSTVEEAGGGRVEESGDVAGDPAGDPRTAGDADSEDEPGSISENEVGCKSGGTGVKRTCTRFGERGIENPEGKVCPGFTHPGSFTSSSLQKQNP